MKSAYWRSQNTFTSHYLLDITVKKRDNTYGINSLVAATTLIKLWLQASALYMFFGNIQGYVQGPSLARLYLCAQCYVMM